MSAESAKALVAKLQSDIDLQNQLKKAKSEEDFLSIAQRQGFEVSIPEFRQAAQESLAAGPKKAMSDEELDKVAGGLSIVGVDYVFVGVQTAS